LKRTRNYSTKYCATPPFRCWWISGPSGAALPHGCPELHALAEEMAGRALILKVNIDTHPELANRYRVQSIPNFVVLKNGKTMVSTPDCRREVKCAAGSKPPETILWRTHSNN